MTNRLNTGKIIIDLCWGTGAWSEPYRQAGYTVIGIDLPIDVRTWEGYMNIYPYGILAAPPCTHLAGSGARWWKGKGDQTLVEAMSVVDACIRIINYCKARGERDGKPLIFHALENPVGRLVRYIGKPVMYFNPCDYGDPWTKKTCLWGEFNIPVKTQVAPVGKNPIWNMPPSPDRAKLRSITPPGFAKAFFKVNK